MNYQSHPGVKPNPANRPQHVAIIMDGNGRWAHAQKLSRTRGHKRGVEVVKEIITACLQREINVLTLFAFGTENWKRPSKEVRNLFRLLFLALRRQGARLHQDNVKLRLMGDRAVFPASLNQTIKEVETLTQNNTALVLNIAVNYSGRWDIVQAMQKLQGNFDEANFCKHLSLSGLPEPDLFIRTGGVMRLSNFMLWELAYTELYFTDALWPDFTVEAFDKALQSYAMRERRFGLTSEQVG